MHRNRPGIASASRQTWSTGAATLAQFLLAAPRLVDSQQLAEATSDVVLFPHQHKVVERLAGAFPRSWLVADEVGLGKTISAGLALRRLILTGAVSRVLVLAPANVARQWQDEMFEKFGLWLPRLDGGKLHGAHPDDVQTIAAGSNPYDDFDLLLVSSHLARRHDQQLQVLAARPYDLIVVDEAQHARRRAADVNEYRPSRLLELLDEIVRVGHSRAMWLLTATPMQVHPIELLDLLLHIGLDGALANYHNFERFYRELAKGRDDLPVDWSYLARMLIETRLPRRGPAEESQAARVATKLGVVASSVLRRFGQPGEDANALAEQLGPSGRPELLAWIRQLGPVGQYVTRHTRETLRHYQAIGLLNEPIATREVTAVAIPLTPGEQRLYDDLDDLLDTLMAAHGTKRGVGFVLTVYRRRLTSSWEAIRRTLRRRLAREGLALDEDLLDEADENDDGIDTGDGHVVDDVNVLPLSNADLERIERYLDDLDDMPDTKFDQLGRDLDAARGAGRPVIVFTQFTDTLDYLCHRLHPRYRSHLATFTGAGGRQWLEDRGWVSVSKQDLVQALRAGRVSVLLATDAASEGLNLQVANYLINYDLPWNPMRVEQRIGRIDRIGQPATTVTIRNYVIPNTVEEAVYQALATRIDLWSGLLGRLQPILGATEDAFRRIFRTPRSERESAQKHAIDDLLAGIDQLDRSGVDLDDDDPLPLPLYAAPPVTLEDLRRCLTEELDVTLDTVGRPATFAPGRASRDPEHWTALATYGHPSLTPALQHRAIDESDPAFVLAEIEDCAVAYRADRTPPQRVTRVTDLHELGAPVALGEAEQLAQHEVDDCARRARARAADLAGQRRQAIETDIRRRFRLLVVNAVRADQLLAQHRDGEAPDPHLVWLALGNDTHSGWSYAEMFRTYLGIELGILLPKGAPGSDERSNRELASVRAHTARELLALVEEWKRLRT
jgi:Helicase conserved C-terminal domain/SNF2-related domain